MPRPLRKPHNDVAPPARAAEALRTEDLDHELGFKRAEERIAGAKGEENAAGARWMLRRMRRRLFS